MKKIEITIETHRVTVIHPAGGAASGPAASGTGWCPACGVALAWATGEEAARVVIVTDFESAIGRAEDMTAGACACIHQEVLPALARLLHAAAE